MTNSHRLSLCLTILLCAACGGPADLPAAPAAPPPPPQTEPEVPQDPNACADGQEAGCQCDDDRFGAMTCVNGAFGACVCEAPPLPPAPSCVEGQSSSCTCTNGDMGAQVCEGGQFNACVCAPPRECTPGTSQSCQCGDGRQGNQTCNSAGSLDACVCEELSCMEQQCAVEQAVCDVTCQATMVCIERCATASCRHMCRDNLDPLTRQRVVDLWSCARGCGFDPSPVPSDYPQIPAGERGRIIYTEDASQFGEAPRDRDLTASYPFGAREETTFGRGLKASFQGSPLHDSLYLEVFSLQPGTYRAELNGGGQASLVINLGGIGFLTSEPTGSPLPVITIAGSSGGVVWGDFDGAVCQRYPEGCIWVGGRFSAHSSR